MQLLARYTVIAVAGLAATTPARAALIADGITYELTQLTTSDPLTDGFVLSISGINASSDTEKGRYGVEAFAFNPPSNFKSAAAPFGFAFASGGLNSGGCNGSGNFFCFSANTAPTGPALAAGSTLSFTFDLTLNTGGSFSGYAPDFKISWEGTKNNYDLVSQTITPTICTTGCGNGVTGSQVVPEPASLALLGAALSGLGLVRRRRGDTSASKSK